MIRWGNGERGYTSCSRTFFTSVMAFVHPSWLCWPFSWSAWIQKKSAAMTLMRPLGPDHQRSSHAVPFLENRISPWSDSRQLGCSRDHHFQKQSSYWPKFLSFGRHVWDRAWAIHIPTESGCRLAGRALVCAYCSFISKAIQAETNSFHAVL